MKDFKKIIALTLITITIASFGAISFAQDDTNLTVCLMDFDLDRDIDH